MLNFHVGFILKVQEDDKGTHLHIFLPGMKLKDVMARKKMKRCGIELEDGRTISAEQRRKIYATIYDISVHTGYTPEETKEAMKYYHVGKTGAHFISFSNCSMDDAKGFINTIIEYCIEHGVALSEGVLLRCDDIGKTLYYCLLHKKCCICGKPGETHHEDAIGMGGDRTTIDDSKHKKICLCREHHTIAHCLGVMEFSRKYKVYGIVFND